MALELAVVIPCYNERPNVAPLAAKLDAALRGVAWEAIYVDDNSPDGTADAVRALGDPRVRCLRRIGRRGLSSAVIEGALSTSARFVAVMDGDLQHDETKLPEMLELLRAGAADLVIGSRHVTGGDSSGLSSGWRHTLSNSGDRLARLLLPVRVSDPMSGFFALSRTLFEQTAPRLNAGGFKILLDLLLAARMAPRVIEIPFRFRERVAGESKLDPLVLAQFAGLLIDRSLGGVVPMRFVSFALVGAVGVLVNLVVLEIARAAGVGFEAAQSIGTLFAMVANFWLNNTITYRTSRLRGAAAARGLLLFVVVCSVGAFANVGIAQALFKGQGNSLIAGGAGAVIGVVWNYAVSSTLVWWRR